MKAMLFAAGLGTRLYPLTKDKPKALAPFGSTTLLGYNLNYLSKQGINSFVINTHHFADEIELYLDRNNNFELDIKISFEKDLLDTAGGLANIRKHLTDDKNILLYNVDIISNINIGKMLSFHKMSDSVVTLATRKRKTSRYLLFDNDEKMIGWKNENTNEIISCKEQENYNKLAFSGISLLNTNILDKLGKVEKKSLIKFYLEICYEHQISSYNHDKDYWFDCGNIDKLNTTENYFRQNNIKH